MRGNRSKAEQYINRGLSVAGDHPGLKDMQTSLHEPDTPDSSANVLQGLLGSGVPQQPGSTANYGQLTGRWWQSDGEILVIEGASYFSMEGGKFLDRGTYAIQGSQFIVSSQMGFSRVVQYNLRGNTLTSVDRITGLPETYVYQRM